MKTTLDNLTATEKLILSQTVDQPLTQTPMTGSPSRYQWGTDGPMPRTATTMEVVAIESLRDKGLLYSPARRVVLTELGSALYHQLLAQGGQAKEVPLDPAAALTFHLSQALHHTELALGALSGRETLLLHEAFARVELLTAKGGIKAAINELAHPQKASS